jgi:hypothetical protein
VTPITGSLTLHGWRWRHLSATQVAHLVPPTVLSRSTTACGKPLQGRILLDLGWGADKQCALCLVRNGGQQ